MLSEKASLESWGSKTIERITRDLNSSFPNISGFSHRNLKFMRQFADSYPDGIRETAVSLIPWGHNVILMQKVQEIDKRLWYAQQVIENGWSRSMMSTWIKSDLYGRQGKAITNFKKTLPSPQSDLAVQMMKDPYNLAFVELDKDYRERELELGLMEHIQKFLLELGQGFAFVGRQVSLVVDGREYFVYLLFYQVTLVESLSKELKESLPTVEDIEAEFGKDKS